MSNTKLDYYKRDYQCKYDGETILKAAERGMFSGGHDSPQSAGVETEASATSMPADQFLRALGIHPEMGKRLILSSLQDIRVLKNQKRFLMLVGCEAGRIRGRMAELIENVIPHPRVRFSYKEDALKEVARANILRVIAQVIRFCEDAIVKNADDED